MRNSAKLAIALAWALVAAVSLLNPPDADALIPSKLQYPFGVVTPSGYSAAASLGASWMRQDGLVYLFQSAAGGPWVWPWDSSIASIEGAGMNFSPVIEIGQCWMSGFTVPYWDPSYPPVDLSSNWNPSYGNSPSYYNFIYTLISHYRGQLDNIAIEAEANSHWAGTPEQLVEVTRTARLAAHNADPNITVFDSGIASEAWGAVIAQERINSGQYTDQQILDFVNAFYLRSFYFYHHFNSIAELQAWLNTPFVANQIYRTNYMLDHLGGAIDGLNLKFCNFWYLYWDVIDYIDRRTQAAGYHMALKVNNEASVFVGASESEYALELIEQEMEGMRLGVARSMWFPLSNQITPTECVGLIDSLGNVRMIGQAYLATSQIIGNGFVFDHLDLSVTNVRQYVFTNRLDPNRSLRVAWYDDGSHGSGWAQVNFNVPAGADRVTKTDYLGRKTVASLMGESSVSVTVSETPVFMEFHANTVQVTNVPATPIAAGTMLDQNYPNPAHNGTAIRFRIPGTEGAAVPATLTIFDAGGRAVRHLVEGEAGAGTHVADWNGQSDAGTDLASGIYFYRLECAGKVESRKLILSR